MAATLAVVGCGSSKTTSSGSVATTSGSGSVATTAGSGSVPATSGGSDCAATAKANADKALAEPALLAPKAAVDAAKLKGKTLWVINVVTNELITAMNAGFKEATTALGMSLSIFDGKGAANEFNTGVAQAVAQKAAGIVLVAIDPTVVSGPLADAKAAGIPVVDIFNGTPADPPTDQVKGHLAVDATASGAALANWILADSGCDVKNVSFAVAGYPSSENLAKGMGDTITGACATCKTTTVNFDVANPATDMPTQVASALTRQADTNYVTVTADSFVTFALPTLTEKNAKVKVVASDGVAANLDNIRKGGLQVADVAFPPSAWLAWASTDEIVAAIEGRDVQQYSIPTRLIDSSNIGTSNDTLFPAYATFQDAFKQAWHIG